MHGPQQGKLDLRFEIPAVCAAQLRSGEVDIGLVPAIELERQPLEMIPGLCIASRGPVRSILVIAKQPLTEIRKLAVDMSSRTSVVLARLLLEKKFGVRPEVVMLPPDVGAMLQEADACLVIGDPALRIWNSRDSLALADARIYDFGAEWTEWTGLPMVYAVWAARGGFDWRPAAEILEQSWEYGRARVDEIAAAEHARRGVSVEVAREYLTVNIHFEMGEDYREGLALFRKLARSSGLV